MPNGEGQLSFYPSLPSCRSYFTIFINCENIDSIPVFAL